jgi:hypothetical protein
VVRAPLAGQQWQQREDAGVAGARNESGASAAAEAAQAGAACEPAGQGRSDRLSPATLFLAACLWRRSEMTPNLALPVWSATPQRLQALGLLAGPAWLAGFLRVVADAAQRAGKSSPASKLRRPKRPACLAPPAAAILALRRPVLTARGLAGELDISPQAALALLKGLVAAGCCASHRTGVLASLRGSLIVPDPS